MRLSDIKNVSPIRHHGNINELRQSITDIGLINPLTIDQEGNLLAGRRRFEAVKTLGWQEVEVRVIPIDGDQLKAFRVSIDENLKRKPLTDPEVASQIKEYDEMARRIYGEKPQGGRPSKNLSNFDEFWTQDKTASVLGIKRSQVSEAIKIATVIEERPELARLKGEQILRTIKIEHQKQDIANLSLLEGVFDVIVIDPPWLPILDYDPDYHRGAGNYPTMAYDEIANIELPISDNSVLWLWVTNYNMHDGLHLLEHWGFEFKAILTWVKDKIGLGAWLRGQTEHCLLGIKGKPLFTGEKESTVLFALRQGHSTKPDEFYNLVNRTCYGRRPYLDYFGRKQREGWKVYGDEI